MQPSAQGRVGEEEDGQTPRALPHVAVGKEAYVPEAPLMVEKYEAEKVQSAPSHDMGEGGGGGGKGGERVGRSHGCQKTWKATTERKKNKKEK